MIEDIAILAVVVGLVVLSGWLIYRLDIQAQEDYLRQVRVRYPQEEEIAKKACGKQRLLYWWLEDPRKASATMHVRCAGQITRTLEVKF